MEEIKKLTINKLAPYLPYGLKIFDSEYQREIVINHATYNISEVGLGRLLRPNYDFSMGLPILRPLSDYNKFEEILDTMSDADVFRLEDNPDLILRLSYETITAMFKNHIDVFGLIPQGLAIDINTLPTNS